MAGLREQAWALVALLAGTIVLHLATGLDPYLCVAVTVVPVVATWEYLARRQERKERMR